MAGIYVQAIDEDGGCHWSDVFAEDYSTEQALEMARNAATMEMDASMGVVTFEAYHINATPFASAKGWDGPVVLHRDGF